MTDRIQRSHEGTVSVLSQKGVLRLRWRIEGSDKRPVLYLGLPDTCSNRKKAELLAKQIEIDLTDGSYDPTLEKYYAQILPTDVYAQVRAQGEKVMVVSWARQFTATLLGMTALVNHAGAWLTR